MPNVEKHAAGAFCWWELATPDLDAAWRFYHGLFRWEKRDAPIGPEQIYRIGVLEGRDVGGMYQLDPDQLARQVPAAWLGYVAVKRADESATQIAAAGGTILRQPFDVMDAGRMALFTDSEGARTAVWEAKQHSGAGIVREVGTVCWNELAARDVARARKFYSSAFGWKPEVKSMGAAGEYTYWRVPGESQPFAGMLQMTAEWGDRQSAWTTYFQVSDCDETAAAATASGGKSLFGPFDAAGVGRFAILADPTEAAFSIIKFG